MQAASAQFGQAQPLLQLAMARLTTSPMALAKAASMSRVDMDAFAGTPKARRASAAVREQTCEGNQQVHAWMRHPRCMPKSCRALLRHCIALHCNLPTVATAVRKSLSAARAMSPCPHTLATARPKACRHGG